MDILAKGQVVYFNLHSLDNKDYEQVFVVLNVWPNWASACKFKGISMDKNNRCLLASTTNQVVVFWYASANSMLSMFEPTMDRCDNQHIYELLMGNKKVFLDHVELVMYNTPKE